MTAEITNSSASVDESANLQPSTSLDDPANLDFYDPEEDNAEAAAAQESAAETVEADDEDLGQETEETAEETDTEADDEVEEGEDQEPEATEIKDDVEVTLQTGDKVALSELKSGYLRQADYSRKTQELGNKRRDLEALATRVTNSVNAIAELLTASVPPMPDQALALTDPQKHYRMKVLHDTAMAKVAEVINKANEPKEALNKLTQEQRAELIQSENAKLVEAFPQTATTEGRKAFFETTASVARELGYSEEEIAQATDHRLFKLAHYARIGMQAEKAKAKAKQKVANVPPVAPAKRQPSANANQQRRNQEAMKRLNRTGSIHDAMAIDFD